MNRAKKIADFLLAIMFFAIQLPVLPLAFIYMVYKIETIQEYKYMNWINWMANHVTMMGGIVWLIIGIIWYNT